MWKKILEGGLDRQIRDLTTDYRMTMLLDIVASRAQRIGKASQTAWVTGKQPTVELRCAVRLPFRDTRGEVVSVATVLALGLLRVDDECWDIRMANPSVLQP